MSENRWLYVNHPKSDFTRQDTGKLTFSDTMRLIIGMGKSTTNDEISEYFDLDPDRIPSQSAFIQRRSQLSPLAFEHLFSQFSYSFPQTTNTFKGRCILACDGSHIVYSTNAEILQDYFLPESGTSRLSRLYYWIFSAVPKTPQNAPYTFDRKLFSQILMLKYLYPDKSKWNSSVYISIETLVDEYLPDISLKHIGFPENWKELLKA